MTDQHDQADQAAAARPYVQIEHGSRTYGWWPPCLGEHDHQPDAAPGRGKTGDDD